LFVVYNDRVPTSLIVTVKNEAASLPRLLDSIATQTRAPDEIVIVDGGSTDTTLDILRANAKHLPIKILSQPGANISQGRNAAIRAARGDIICSTDAGVRLDSAWLEEITRPFEEAGVDVVSGFFVPEPQSVFETALAATTLPVPADIRPEKFLPSSRSIAFRKGAWEKVNGYPEWLDYCEDLLFDFALRAANCRFMFAPRAVAHFRPRENLCGFAKQYYQYARGDGKANLWFTRHVIRYATYFLVLPLTVWLLSVMPLLGFVILVFGFLAMFYTPYKRLLPMLRNLTWLDKLRAIAWVPVIRVAGDGAKMTGYPVGVVWRMRGRSQ
jgi:glycosyltransferase involved in cell wall biosynthesis